MSMGAYDDAEHERRERKNSEVATSSDDSRTHYEGTVEYEGADSADELLDRFRELQSR
jgi:hypothetical protein